MNRMRFRSLSSGVTVAALVGLSLVVHGQVTINIVYGDYAGEGFNDPTLGAARKAAFVYAVTIWEGLLTSSVAIDVTAEFNPMDGTPTSATLGSAGAWTYWRDFTGAPIANTWYADPLADSHRGLDIGGTYEIRARFNSDVDGSYVLGTTDWYYGTDANPGSDIDFVTVVLHELCHGLNFSTLVSWTGAWAGSPAYPDIYGRFLQEGNPSGTLFTAMTNVQRQAAIISGDVWFTGARVKAANGGANGRIYSPNPYESGSSMSHWDTSFSPNEVMEPSYTGPDHTPGLAVELLGDLGWTLGPAPVMDWRSY